jgi:hypothetical protein
MKKLLISILALLVLSIFVNAQPSIQYLVYPKYVGAVGATSTLENPLAFYIKISNLPPNTAFEGMHMGFNGASAPTSTRGSKWTGTSWVSPSTVVPFQTSDDQGVIKAWVYLRPPTNFSAADSYRVRIRIRNAVTKDTLTFDSNFDIMPLVFSDTATGPLQGAVIYGYTDTVTKDYGGRIILAFASETDERPLSAWLIQRATDETSDLYLTRMDTTLRKKGYFQLLVPANTPIRKIEIRDSNNVTLARWTSTQWQSGPAGSKTQINLSEGVLSVKDRNIVVSDFELHQNYPNPFNPGTWIKFELKEESNVSLSVYNLLGQHIVTLLDNERIPAGERVVYWDGKDGKGQPVASGVYIYKLDTKRGSKLKYMVLIR